MEFAGEVVFITGGGGGIGGGMAAAFAGRGARIVLAGINPNHAEEDSAVPLHRAEPSGIDLTKNFEKGPILDAQYDQIRLPTRHRETPAFPTSASTMKLTSVPYD